MPAIRHDPKADIQLIRNILRSGYEDGFPILQELLQNADDPGSETPDHAASKVVIVLAADGLSEARHSLLRQPGLCVLNDGEFRKSDAECLPTLGLSDKAVEATAIGKFGIGLKTVFYLAEAFFYFCSRDDDWSEDAKACDLVNPWGKHRQTWEDEWKEAGRDDHQALRAFGASCLQTRRFFGVWIPLRQQGGAGELIHQHFPGPDCHAGNRSLDFEDVFGDRWHSLLLSLLPLLRHVRTVLAGHFSPVNGFAQEMEFNPEQGSTYVRLTSDREQAANGWNDSFAGSVRFQHVGDAPHLLRYFGVETLGRNELRQPFHAAENWPRQAAPGETTDQKERATPHAAVVFARQPAADNRRLRIQHAVFLPLREAEDVGCRGEWDYGLLLHGFFFVDVNRRDIEQFDIDSDGTEPSQLEEKELRKAWNRAIHKELLCPQLVPALDGFVKQAGVTPDETANLVKALKDSETLKAYKEWLYAEHQFVLRLNPEGVKWQMIDAKKPVFAIPAREFAPERLFEALPGLKEVAGREVVTLEGKPWLAAEKPKRLPDELLAEVLMDCTADLFSDALLLDYVLDLLPQDMPDMAVGSPLIRTVVRLCRPALTQPFSGNRQGWDNWLELFRRLPAGALLKLPTDSGSVSEIIASVLARAELAVVMIWSDWAKDIQTAAKLPWGSVKPLLSDLAGLDLTDENAIRQRSDIAVRLLEANSVRPDGWFEEIADLALFAVEPVSAAGAPASARDLQRCHECGWLFQSGKDARILLSALQRAAPGLVPVLVEGAIAVLLGLELPPSNSRQCVQLVHNAEGLAQSFADRKPLFDKLLALAGSVGDSVWPALRCLLHGEISGWQDGGDLFEANAQGIEPVLSKLVSKALTGTRQPWRLIPAEVTRGLEWSDTQRRWLGLTPATPAKVEALLREVGPEKVDCGQLTRDECDLILQRLNDVDILRGLNIHETTDERRVRVEAHTYVNDEKFDGLPAVFNEIVVRVRPNPNYARFQTADHANRLVPELGWESVIRIALGQPNPAMHWVSILTGIQKLNDLRAELRDDIKAVPWVPLPSERDVAPSQLLHVPGADDEIARLPTEVLGNRVPLRYVAEAAREHRGFDKFTREVLPRVETVLKDLADLLRAHPDFRTGLSDVWTLDALADWVQAVEGVGADGLPLAPLSKALYENEGVREHLLPFLEKLNGPLSEGQYGAILKHLIVKHEQADAENRQRVEQVFLRYLRAIGDNGADFARMALKKDGVRLLSEAGKWKSPAELAFPANGIVPEDQLCQHHADTLACLERPSQRRKSPGVEISREPSFEKKLAATEERLRSYFSKWEGLVAREVIGGFLSVLGPGEQGETEKVASEYLGQGSLEGTLDVIVARCRSQNPDRLRNQIKGSCLACAVHEGQSVKILSVLGHEFLAHTGGKITTVFLGSGKDAFQADGAPSRLLLTLVSFDPGGADYTQDRLADILRASTEFILCVVFGQEGIDLSDLWARLSQPSQLHIKIAQNLLVDDARAFLRQVGAQQDGEIRRVLKDWDSACRRIAEAQENDRAVPANGNKELQDAKERLRSLLASNQATQGSLLASVRRKVEQFQYRASSVPFELWQNADDALAELERLGSDAERAAGLGFVVKQSPDGLLFVHWGRPINEFQGPGEQNCRDAGFDRDLEKMLVLAISDKGDGSGRGRPALTGKFGLGFKSVLLVSDAPEVLSGNVDFVIRGGIYPVRLSDQPRQALKSELEHFAKDDVRRGTAIRLPLRQDVQVNPDEVLAPFRRFSPLLLVFSRRLKRLRMKLGDAPELDLRWSATPVGESACEFGKLPQTVGKACAGLLLSTEGGAGGDATLLLGMNSDGFVSLLDDVPVFWVTAPTQDTSGYGFAVNGPFDPDVGRVQLAGNSEKNRNVARELGYAVAQRLKSLWGLTQDDWPAARQQLALAPGMVPYAFWESLWGVLGVRFASKCAKGDSTVVGELARAMLWDSEGSGLRSFYTECPALPTGLWGEYLTVTRLDSLTYRAAGALDKQEVFEQAAKWPEFQKKVNLGQICSDSAVGKSLAGLGVLPEAVVSVNLATAVEWEVGDRNHADSDKASLLGALVTKKFKDDLAEKHPDEHKELTTFLRDIKFRAEDGSWHRPAELLVPGALAAAGAETDESLRAAFAPPERRLGPAYTGQALEFFRACRERFEADIEQMLDWVWMATDPGSRIASLRYLLHKEATQRTPLAERLRERLRRERMAAAQECWLWNVGSEAWWDTSFNEEEGKELLQHVLRLCEFPFQPPPTRDANGILNAIYRWWTEEANQQGLISAYESRLYPYGRRPRLDPDPEHLRRDTVTRKEWLILWLLGGFHTIGRTQDCQHRNFLELCEEKGWLDVFANPHSVGPDTRSDEFLEVLDEYFQNQIEASMYYHWFREFVTIYKFARWLPEYVERVLATNRMTHRFALDSVTSPRLEQGFDAPPSTAALGLGANFIMREMARFEVLKNPLAFEHCYVPVGRLREFMKQIGGFDGIYGCLCHHLGEERATFANAFDLPLLFVADSQPLQQRFLNAPLSLPEGEEGFQET